LFTETKGVRSLQYVNKLRSFGHSMNLLTFRQHQYSTSCSFHTKHSIVTGKSGPAWLLETSQSIIRQSYVW